MPGPFGYFRPKTREEALELLSRDGCANIPLLFGPKPPALRQMGADAFVDLDQLGLDAIHVNPGGSISIGGLASLQSIAESALLHGTAGLLKNAATTATNLGMRNLCSLWGCIQERNGPPEVRMALLALEARIILLQEGELKQDLSIQDHLETGLKKTLKGQLMLEAVIPTYSGGWSLERIARTPRDESIVAAAACVEIRDGIASRVTLALAGADQVLKRFIEIENELTGRTFDAHSLEKAASMVMEQADPPGDYRGTAEYRRAMTGLISKRALAAAWKMAKGEVKE